MTDIPLSRLDAHGFQVHVGDTVLVEAEVIDWRGDTLLIKVSGYGSVNCASKQVVRRTRPSLTFVETPDRTLFGRKLV